MRSNILLPERITILVGQDLDDFNYTYGGYSFPTIFLKDPIFRIFGIEPNLGDIVQIEYAGEKEYKTIR